ncbi:DnaB-like helicase C-terminal domain-containing protein [Lactobacillus delbrueckii]|jgi:replicative DNA helicase|uniref:Putative primase-helicase n=21 Tax=Bacillati TaxID=1783272 RepID=A2TEW2_LACDE|nr:DnaB-like helicase C-terminal domain-containing protein [Lactobacillus delbrueckii]ABM79765.1 putative primase-helicase [Lactobacillus delbrueckii subsp. bulgaricus]ABM79773.1 putative primase-helicase [Shuttle cloning vector pDOJ4]ADQ62075.1 Putative primase-helicase [Lactobacillus delbrueckii subsp. bulgaricus ND02]MCD5469676.1 toprim domain-containing protein [Lactobacillus delbrueckii subsp. lactis]MCZ0796985.1 toprim domain-containing protein [Lactobacillus delbrueckii subsp. lactis]
MNNLVKPADLKSLISLPEYIASVVSMDSKGFFSCVNPNHPDKHPSMCVDQNHPQYVHCFSCQASYDLFDCWALINDGVTETRKNSAGKEKPVYNFNAVAIEIADHYGYTLIGDPANNLPEPPLPEPEPEPAQTQTSNDSNIRAQLEAWHASLNQTDYLQKRGITQTTAEIFNLGYSALTNSIIIPYGQDGYYVQRAINPIEKHDRYRFPIGQVRVYNAEALKECKTVFIVEGQFDALSIMQESGVGAVATSTSQTRLIVKTLQKFKEQDPTINPTIILSMDNDRAGQKANRALQRDLEAHGFTCYVNPVNGDYKDANEFLVKDREGFRQKLQHVINQPDNWLDKYYADIKNRHDYPDNIPTGFKNLDDELDGGLQPKLYVLGAVSSLGKTTFALNIADNLAKQGRHVFFFSMESSKREVTDKLLSRASCLSNGHKWTQLQVSRGAWLNNAEDKEEFDGLFKAFSRYQRFLHIYDNRVKASQVKDLVNSWLGNHPDEKKPLVVVDYLQILQAEQDNVTDKAKVTDSVSVLSELTKQAEVPVLVISSLNRASYWQDVSFESFKESGEIEYSADVMLGLEFAHREEYITVQKNGHVELNKEKFDQRKQEVPRRVEMVILKNRTGKTGGHIFFKYNAMFNSYQACTEKEAAIANNFKMLYHTKQVGKPVEAARIEYTVDPETGRVTEKNQDK